MHNNDHIDKNMEDIIKSEIITCGNMSKGAVDDNKMGVHILRTKYQSDSLW